MVTEPTIYECWEDPDGTTSMVTTREQALQFAQPGEFARYSIRAFSWTEAMQVHHEIQGFEPYIPEEE